MSYTNNSEGIKDPQELGNRNKVLQLDPRIVIRQGKLVLKISYLAFSLMEEGITCFGSKGFMVFVTNIFYLEFDMPCLLRFEYLELHRS